MSNRLLVPNTGKPGSYTIKNPCEDCPDRNETCYVEGKRTCCGSWDEFSSRLLDALLSENLPKPKKKWRWFNVGA